jgi:hypothetical protein
MTRYWYFQGVMEDLKKTEKTTKRRSRRGKKGSQSYRMEGAR